MKLTWQTSEMVSCLYAAEAWLRAPSTKDAGLAGALTAPVTALLQTLLEQGVPPDDFWSHVVPLAVSADPVAEPRTARDLRAPSWERPKRER